MQKQNHPTPKNKKDLSVIIKENWFVIFIVSSFFIVLTSLLIQRLLPEQIPVQENTWNGVTPGYSKINNLIEKMGTPIDTIETEDGYKIKYQSDFLAIPTEVVADKDGTVQFIKERLKYDSNHNLKQYVEQYGEPNIVLFNEEIGSSIKANVFLEEGLVIMSHEKDGSVEGKWYFNPTDETNFMSSWGADLELKSHEPHRALF